MHRYDIRDIWMALRLSVKNFFFVSIGWLLLAYSFSPNIVIVGVFLIFIQSIFIYLANSRYIIDTKEGFVMFPRSDIENSIIAIIMLFRYWNLMRTMTVSCSDIENIYVDTKRKIIKSKGTNKKSASKQQILYTINITGKFGSANLQFLDRQKRDEVRNAVQQCSRKYNRKNIDKKVAEFEEFD